MKVVTIIGARPQFIKSAPVSKALKNSGIQEVTIHTGQHYDANMSAVFFDEMALPKPHEVNWKIPLFCARAERLRRGKVPCFLS